MERSSVPPWLMNPYERVLRLALGHPLLLAVFCVLLIGGSYVCYRNCGSDLLPAMDEGGFIIDYIMPAGSSLDETNRVVSHVEQILRAVPEVEGTSRRTGLQLGLAAVTEANTGDISVKLKRKRSRSGDEVIADVRAKVKAAEPVLDVEFPQLLQDMIGDLTNAPEPVVIKLFSPDPELLQAWAPKIGDTIKKIPGVVDVLDGIENTISGPATLFNVEPSVTARAGFSPRRWNWTPAPFSRGNPPRCPWCSTTALTPFAFASPSRRAPPWTPFRTHCWSVPPARPLPLGSLAKVVEIPGQTEIRRENLQRDVAVTARFEGMNLGDGMAKVQQAIAEANEPAAQHPRPIRRPV
jgi:multidrug efflux pump subunit AcrB